MDFSKKGYTIVPYQNFIEILKSAYADLQVSYAELAVACSVKSPASIQNAFNTDMQKLSDVLLSKFANIIVVDCYIIYKNGERGYLVNNNDII